MTGKLHYSPQGWTVTYITSDSLPNGTNRVRVAEIDLHLDDTSLVTGHYVDDEYNIRYVYDNRNVEFEIVDNYAKLLKQ